MTRSARSTPAGGQPSTPTYRSRFAKSGLADEARDRIAANLIRWPHDVWIRVHAGDALVALGDPEGAAAHFEAALRMADESDDLGATSEVIDRLRKAT